MIYIYILYMCIFINICMYIRVLLLRHFSCVRLCATPQMAAHQAPCPWDSPGKNTGVGCHFLLQCMKVKSESEVAQSCPTLSDPIGCSPPGSSVHGIFQPRVLEWGAIAFSIYMYICLYMCKVYMCVYIYIYTYTHTCVYVCVYMCIRTSLNSVIWIPYWKNLN